jgi:hypothetical protein
MGDMESLGPCGHNWLDFACYAAGALDDEIEARAVEVRAVACATCSDELGGHLDVAGLIYKVVDVAPASVWRPAAVSRATVCRCGALGLHVERHSVRELLVPAALISIRHLEVSTPLAGRARLAQCAPMIDGQRESSLLTRSSQTISWPPYRGWHPEGISTRLVHCP